MTKFYAFPADRVKRRRACVGCGLALEAAAPAHHKLCPKCNTYSHFKRVALAMRKVQP